MSQVKFGIFFPQTGMPFSVIQERAQLADRLGFDSLWCVDHMWTRGMLDVDQLEAWTLISALAPVTEQLRLGTLVTCNSYRNPALFAKMSATLDHISNGRFNLGLGAGWMEEEYHAYGYPFPPIKTRLDQLDEALAVIKRLWTEPRASFQGKYYSVEDAPNHPKPTQTPHPPILIGGAGEQRMLRIVAEHADIWNCPNNVSKELGRKLSVLKRHCDAVQRDFNEIEISEQSMIVLGKDDADYKNKLSFAQAAVGNVFDLDVALKGTPEQVIEAIEKRRSEGVTFFIMLFGDLNQAESLELFAEKVAPAFA